MMGPEKKLSGEQVLILIEQYRSGSTPTEISKSLGIPRTSVRREIARAGVPLNEEMTKPRVSDRKKNAIVEAYVSGFNAAEIACKYSISVATVHRAVSERGLTRGKNGNNS